jgi:hypothetical protein
VDSKKQRDRRAFDIFLIAALVIVLIGVIFELYGHYAYVHTKGNTVVRVDRITGDSCVLPCTGESDGGTYSMPLGTPSPAGKSCHAANVVRVATQMAVPADRKPVEYSAGGFDPHSKIMKSLARHVVPFASELSDGHIYAFSRISFGAVSTWSTGQDVEVCATWSQIEQRPYFSVGVASDDAEPAQLAI